MENIKRILALGSGSVSRPCVQYLLKRGYEVIVVDLSESSIKRTLACHPNGIGVVRNAVTDAVKLIREYKPELVVCLLPAAYLTQTAAICVSEGISMIGASYVRDELRALDGEARRKGIKILCEVGLDPGIDHMSAAAKIKEIREQGGVIESFISACGALPDFASNTNPIGYKLSWAPASLVGASKRSARIMMGGEKIDLPNGTTYQNAEFFNVAGLGWFEAYANADSIPYLEAYGMEEAKTIKRMTIRYFGWCDMITQMQKLNLFDESERDFSSHTYASLLKELAGGNKAKNTEQSVSEFLGISEKSLVMLKLKWLGFFDDIPVKPQIGSLRGMLSGRYAEKLTFSPGEMDLVVMQHEYRVFYPQTGKRKKYISTMIERGSVDEDTAIARTTGLPLGISAHLVLEGAVKNNGVIIPVTSDIYEPALEELSKEGIRFIEREE